MSLSDDLSREWRANALRWEPYARSARKAGLEVWNPGVYAGGLHARYLRLFPPRRGALLGLGLNPGPYGMAQTGIPFTDCRTASGELGLELRLPGLAPADLARRLRGPDGRWRATYERSSLGMYRFLKAAWGDVGTAASDWFVGNPCPLLFLDPAAWNVTPADLRLRRIPGLKRLREEAVERICAVLRPRGIVCFGKDVADAVGETAERLVGAERLVRFGHPARASPRLWAEGLVSELRSRGLLSVRRARPRLRSSGRG